MEDDQKNSELKTTKKCYLQIFKMQKKINNNLIQTI